MGMDVSRAKRGRLEGLRLAERLVYGGWKLASAASDGIADTAFNPELNARLSAGGTIPYVLSDAEYATQIAGLAARRVEELRAEGKVVFDATKIRLDDEPFDIASLSKTTYFSGVVTNELCLKDFNPSDDERIDGTELAYPGGVIPSLGDSAMSNHLGASALGIDGHGVMMFCLTGASSAVAASKISPAASGSCDLGDFEGHSDLAGAISLSLSRELREEAGLVPNAFVETRILGFLRALERGGKPEFVGIARLTGQWKDFTESLGDEERTFTEGHLFVNVSALGEVGVRSWFAEHSDMMSYAARTAFMAFAAEMSRDGSTLAEWLGLQPWSAQSPARSSELPLPR